MNNHDDNYEEEFEESIAESPTEKVRNQANNSLEIKGTSEIEVRKDFSETNRNVELVNVGSADGTAENDQLMKEPYSSKFHEPSMFFDAEESALNGIDYIMISQKNDCLENILPLCCEIPNEYLICETDPSFSSNKKVIGVSLESSNCCPRYCCLCYRKWQIDTMIYGTGESRAVRDCFCPFFGESVVRVTFERKIIGFVKHKSLTQCFTAKQVLTVTNADHDPIFTISGKCCQPGCLCCCCGCLEKCANVEYVIFNNAQDQVGSIQHVFDSCFRDICTRADKFGVRFPKDCSMREKFLLIHAAILLDYVQYSA